MDQAGEKREEIVLQRGERLICKIDVEVYEWATEDKVEFCVRLKGRQWVD